MLYFLITWHSTPNFLVGCSPAPLPGAYEQQIRTYRSRFHSSYSHQTYNQLL
jgi:hypothetical protein